MPGCCVPLCKNRSGGNGERKYSFHRFPACREKREKWLNLIRRDDFTPTANTRVCSWHFSDGFEAGPTRFHWNVTETTNADPMSAPSYYTKKKLRVDAEENGLAVLASVAQSQCSTEHRDGDPVILRSVSTRKGDRKGRSENKQLKDRTRHSVKTRPTQKQINSHLAHDTQTQSRDISHVETYLLYPARLHEDDKSVVNNICA